MLGVVAAIVVTAWLCMMLIKKTYAPAVLITAGVILMVIAAVFGLGEVLPAKNSTGFVPFDIFDQIRRMFSTRMGGLGLQIMLIAGYSKYMEKIQASTVLCEILATPIRRLNSPMLVFAFTYFVTQMLQAIIPSAVGLALICMITFYPILVQAGFSRLTACALIASSRALSWGPAAPNSVVATQTTGIDLTQYFLTYHTPVVLFLMVVMLVVHLVVQPYFDRKEGPDTEGLKLLAQMQPQTGERPPLIYSILPVLPLILIIGCSPLVVEYFGLPYSVKMNVGTAMIISTFVALVFELIRTRSAKEVLTGWKPFFESMGKMFTSVVVLIVAGEIFAKGLVLTGVLASIIDGANHAGFGAFVMTSIFGGITWISAILMGSGNAAFFSFCPMVPAVAEAVNADPNVMMVALDLYSTFGRTMSPITGAIVAVAGIASVSPFAVAKRTAIPMIVCGLVMMPYIHFYFGFGG